MPLSFRPLSISSRRRGAIIALCTLFGACVFACVDLFHGTDFTTLCDVDATACDLGFTSTPDGSIKDSTTPDTETGVVADTGPIDPCSWSSAEANAHAERACAWLGACEGAGSLPRSSFGSCVVRARAAYDCHFNPSLRPQKETAATWMCLASATSCDIVNTCLFGGATQQPPCESADGGVFTVCDTSSRAVVECALPNKVNPPVGVEACSLTGRKCIAANGSVAACAGLRGVTCTGAPGCNATFGSTCKSVDGTPTDIGIDCASFGSGACVQDDAGVVACAPITTAPPCSDGTTITCSDPGVAHSCVAGKTVTIDCTALSLGCNASGASALDPLTACTELDAGAQCTPTATSDECNGDALTSCALGKRFTLSCASVGLGACTNANGYFAKCTAP